MLNYVLLKYRSKEFWVNWCLKGYQIKKIGAGKRKQPKEFREIYFRMEKNQILTMISQFSSIVNSSQAIFFELINALPQRLMLF